MIEGERDGWILVAAHSPERMPELMADKRKQIEDPEIVDLYRALGEAIDWDPDDPRLPPLADRLGATIDRAMADTTTRTRSWLTGLSNSSTRCSSTPCPSPTDSSNCSKNADGRAGPR
jgi:hypothetical protein